MYIPKMKDSIFFPLHIWHQLKLTDIWPKRTVKFFFKNRHRRGIFWAFWLKPNFLLKIWVPWVTILFSKYFFFTFWGVNRVHGLEVRLIRPKKAYLWMQFTPLFIKQSIFFYGLSEKFSSSWFSSTTDFLLTDKKCLNGNLTNLMYIWSETFKKMRPKTDDF